MACKFICTYKRRGTVAQSFALLMFWYVLFFHTADRTMDAELLFWVP